MKKRLAIEKEKIKNFDWVSFLIAEKRGANRRTYNKDEGYVLFLTYLFYNMVKFSKPAVVTSHLPSAAVLSVPKGRLRSDTGSHTNISPSKMILRKKGSMGVMKGFITVKPTRQHEDRMLYQ